MPSLTVGNSASHSAYVAALGTTNKTHTVASGSNILLACFTTESVSDIAASCTMTFNGDALTAVTNANSLHGSTWLRANWFYLLNPDVGTYTLATTLTGTGDDGNVGVQIFDFGNHDGSAPTGNFIAAASSASTINPGSISYTDGDKILVGFAGNDSSYTNTWSSGTEAFDYDATGSCAASAVYTASGSGSVTITTTMSTAQPRSVVSAIRISPVAAVPTILTVGTLNPGATVAVTYENYAAVPLTANSTLNGIGITVSGATLVGCNITAPAESAFLFGGAHAATRFLTNVNLVLANGAETDTIVVQVSPASTDQIAARSAAALVNAIDSYNGGLTVATNDDVYQYSDPADAFTPYPATNDFTALEPAFTLYTKFYDVLASSWSSLTSLAFPAADAPGGGTLSITGSQESIKPPGTTVPGSYSLTSYGSADWIKTARTAHTTFDTKSGGTIIATPSDINTPAWTRNDGGDSTSDPLLSWTDGTELASYAGDRYVEYTTTVGAGKRFVISPAGALVNLYLWVGTYQGAGRITVTFSDSSAGPLTYDFSSTTGIYEVEQIQIQAQPTGGAATIQVDVTHVSGFSTGWAALAVGTGTPSALFSLTSSDTTVMPGQTITATLVGGPFQGAVTAAYAVYGEHEIPLAWTVISPTLTDVTIPSLNEFAAGQTAEYLPWYGNFTIRIVAGEESADSPNTNQVVAPNPGDYGTVAAPPWGYPPSGAQEGDKAYGYVVNGAGTFTPETFDFTESGPSLSRYKAFSVASQSWLADHISYTGPMGTGRVSISISL